MGSRASKEKKEHEQRREETHRQDEALGLVTLSAAFFLLKYIASCFQGLFNVCRERRLFRTHLRDDFHGYQESADVYNHFGLGVFPLCSHFAQGILG